MAIWLRPIARLLNAIAVMAALLMLPSSCDFGGSEAGAERAPKIVSVETLAVASQLLRDVATFSGQLSAENSVLVKSETDGVVDEVLFEEGQPIQKDAVLLRLRNREQVARLREAQANLSLAREVNARTRNLVTRDAASLAQKDQAAAELAVARARVDLARVALERTEIRAPFDGVLGMRLVSPGDRITDETPLVQIDAIERLQLSFAISEEGILFARLGATIEVRVRPYPNETFPGTVFFVSPSLDPVARRVIVKAWVPNEHRRLRAGLFANVDLEVARRDNAILVPESAVVFDRNGTYVWKIDDESVATRIPIEVGLRKHGQVEVTLGLAPGDVIVTAGTHKVSEGKKVAAVAAPRSSAGQALRDPPQGGGLEEGT